MAPSLPLRPGPRLGCLALLVVTLGGCSGGGLGVDPLSDIANIGAKNPLIPNQVAGGARNIGGEAAGQTTVGRDQQHADTLHRAHLNQRIQFIFRAGKTRNVRQHLARLLRVRTCPRDLGLSLAHFGCGHSLHGFGHL